MCAYCKIQRYTVGKMKEHIDKKWNMSNKLDLKNGWEQIIASGSLRGFVLPSYYLTQYVSCTLKGLINVFNVEISRYQGTSQGVISIAQYIVSALYYLFNPNPQKGIYSPRHFFFLPQRVSFSLYCIIGFIVGNFAREWIPSCHFITGRPMSDTWNEKRSCPYLMRDQMSMMIKMQQTIL